MCAAAADSVAGAEKPQKTGAWGIQQWVTYTESASGTRSFAEDGDIRCWLPTLEYFVELPFRIGEAEVVAHAGETELDDATQDLVFVSWKTAEPQARIDQYALWISRSTGLVDYSAYTVRDKPEKPLVPQPSRRAPK